MIFVDLSGWKDEIMKAMSRPNSFAYYTQPGFENEELKNLTASRIWKSLTGNEFKIGQLTPFDQLNGFGAHISSDRMNIGYFRLD